MRVESWDSSGALDGLALTLTMHRSDGTRERPSEHQMIIYSAKPYNQRLTTLNTYQ